MQNEKLLDWVNQLQNYLVLYALENFEPHPLPSEVFMEKINKADLIPDWVQWNAEFYEMLFKKYLEKCNHAGKNLEIKMFD